MLVLYVETHPRSLCCTFKRDNIQNGHCLHAEEEGLSGNPYQKLQSQVQLQFPHTCTGFLLKRHKTCLPTCPKSCTEPNLACLWLHTKSDALPLSTKHTMETVLSRKGLQLEQMSAALSERASTGMLNSEFAKYASVCITYKLWSAPQGKCRRRGRRGGY